MRAREVLRGDVDTARVVDRVVLDADARHRRRVAMVGERGTTFLLDLAEATLLRDGDCLLLDDGTVVLVVGEAEQLIEIVVPDPVERLRIAWHLGNRHTPVQIVGDRLRIRPDHVLEDMLRGLGASLADVAAPFDPESGAYGHAHDAHSRSGAHSHAHPHEPGHRHHDHEHGS